MRECKVCGVTKEHKEFRPKQDCLDGIEPTCRDCRNEHKRKTRKSRAGCIKHKEAWAKYYKDNKDDLLRKQRASKSRSEGAKARYKKKREYILNQISEYRKTPAGKINQRNCRSRRRASESRATPHWLTEDQKSQIRDQYWLATDLEIISGESYHVDHIVPLQGKNICGLHVPWNLQVLPSDINQSKSNSYKDI